ncbi:hypothetical protein A142_15690 [Vibrio splendidus 12E03]|uniref:Uncharacterized protein n=1 Tax=Vibrio splendidus 12E03 TaxID=1191305 RepID=A0A1E5FWJ8_VIBSP|nr:hypothetical protein A142_15690 [Vibrio splendidus 12E03]
MCTIPLFRIAEAALNNPNGQVKEVLYPVAGEDTLKNTSHLDSPIKNKFIRYSGHPPIQRQRGVA